MFKLSWRNETYKTSKNTARALYSSKSVNTHRQRILKLCKHAKALSYQLESHYSAILSLVKEVNPGNALKKLWHFCFEVIKFDALFKGLYISLKHKFYAHVGTTYKTIYFCVWIFIETSQNENDLSTVSPKDFDILTWLWFSW